MLQTPLTHRLSVAPMMDWTDRHCRYLHRLITTRTLLYTEMINAGAIVYGGTERHLKYNPEEHPVALQLGGSEPTLLAQACKLASGYGYDEINLNCGCPSARVQRGAFGACLMREADLVADCIKAMQDACTLPITVKHRIGLDRDESPDLLHHFIHTLAQAGCSVFIVHARNAWLQGLSPKENRDIPPLRYEVVYQLKQIFPKLTIILNGGVHSNTEIATHLEHVDGVMVGRSAYHNPWLMHDWDSVFGELGPTGLQESDVEAAYVDYMERQQRDFATAWPSMARHMLGLYHGRRGARLWRQVWSDHRLKDLPVREVYARAQQVWTLRDKANCDAL